MNITGITITGADDSIHPEALIELSNAYPFVEWGILYSITREGMPRYPSKAWRDWFAQIIHVSDFDALMAGTPAVKVSTHLCGRDAMHLLGHDSLCSMAHRAQINGFTEMSKDHSNLDLILKLCDATLTKRFILQCSTIEAHEYAQELLTKSYYDNVDELWDQSGGTGTILGKIALIGGHIGYAGGISPENIQEIADWFIGSEMITSDTWLDMESRVRDLKDPSLFSLKRAQAVLEIAKGFVKETVYE